MILLKRIRFMCENIHFDAYIQNNANFDGQEIIDKACDDMIFISHVRPQTIKKNYCNKFDSSPKIAIFDAFSFNLTAISIAKNS